MTRAIVPPRLITPITLSFSVIEPFAPRLEQCGEPHDQPPADPGDDDPDDEPGQAAACDVAPDQAAAPRSSPSSVARPDRPLRP